MVLTEEYNVIVNSEELIGTTEYLSLWTRCSISQCRYNRFRLYYVMIIYIKFKICVLYIVLHISYALNKKLLSDVIVINVLHIPLLLLHKFHSLITCPQRDALKSPCTPNSKKNEMLYLFLIIQIKKLLLICIKLITNQNNT
jgi:hypothetical protein